VGNDVSNDPKWGWMRAESEEAYGPFASREVALAAAQADVDENPGEESVVILGRCDYVEPVDHIPDNLQDTLEGMDQSAIDGMGLDCDTIHEATDGAQEALTAALEAWAREWVTSSAWQLAEVERITIRQGGAP